MIIVKLQFPFIDFSEEICYDIIACFEMTIVSKLSVMCHFLEEKEIVKKNACAFLL